MPWRITITSTITKDYATQAPAAIEAVEMERHLKMSKDRFCKAINMNYTVHIGEINGSKD